MKVAIAIFGGLFCLMWEAFIFREVLMSLSTLFGFPLCQT